jgi:flagellar basal-body rod modification protein FlgD
MTTTSTVSSSSISSALTSSGATNPSSAQSLQNEFLTLLTTQLQNQDPLNPMDNSELTSQLAQISTVEGITNLNTTLQSIGSQLDLSQAINTAGLVGAGVLVDGSSIKLGTNSSTGGLVTTPFGFDLQGSAADVTVSIYDNNGKLVNTVDLGSQSAGILSYNWDGTSSTGATVSDGTYSFKVTAVDSSGASVTADPLNYAQVGSVSYTSSGAVLNLGTAGTATLSDIRKIFGTTDDSKSI